MKKIRFAVQIFILAISFPLLFISGISHGAKKTTSPATTVQDSTIVNKSITGKACVCSFDSRNNAGNSPMTWMKY